MRTRKILLRMLLTGCLAFSAVMAQAEGGIVSRAECLLVGQTTKLRLSGDKADIVVNAQGKNSVKRMNLTYTLQKAETTKKIVDGQKITETKWKACASWTKEVNSQFASIERKYTLKSKGRYRIKFKVKYYKRSTGANDYKYTMYSNIINYR